MKRKRRIREKQCTSDIFSVSGSSHHFPQDTVLAGEKINNDIFSCVVLCFCGGGRFSQVLIIKESWRKDSVI